MKTDLIYSNETLFVNFNGSINKKELSKLKSKINYITNEYPINDIVFDAKNLVVDSNSDLNNFIDNYKYEFSGEIIIKK